MFIIGAFILAGIIVGALFASGMPEKVSIEDDDRPYDWAQEP